VCTSSVVQLPCVASEKRQRGLAVKLVLLLLLLLLLLHLSIAARCN
jgi:Tfp pilus assembly protein PilX